QRLLVLLAQQAALIIERTHLVRQAAQAQVLADTDRLKSSLLSSVSHDLRTPLTVIKGAASTLLADKELLVNQPRRDLLQTIEQEADRLNRLVGNLLNMSRIEGGALDPARDWNDIGNIISGVLVRLRPQLAGRSIRVILPPDLPMVWINAALIDQ